jgi:hypothetical protein
LRSPALKGTLDVIAQIGAWRYQEHRSVPEIHARLRERHLPISKRSVCARLLHRSLRLTVTPRKNSRSAYAAFGHSSERSSSGMTRLQLSCAATLSRFEVRLRTMASPPSSSLPCTTRPHEPVFIRGCDGSFRGGQHAWRVNPRLPVAKPAVAGWI